MIRRLQDDFGLRAACGFAEADGLPRRRTFNRFIRRLADHQDLIAGVFHSLTDRLRDLLPGFGDVVAIDSTDVHSHSNPYKKSKVTGLPSDPEARWGVAHSVRAKDKDGKVFYFGYKVHMVVDGTHDLPIAFKVTPGNRNDSPELPDVIDRAIAQFAWFRPRTLLGDRGYDSKANFEYLYLKHGIDPIIHIRVPTTNTGLYEDIYTADARPTCIGMVPMEHVGQDGEGGHVFRCRSEGCHLKDSKQGGIRHCDTVIVEHLADNLRVMGGRTWRGSREWWRLYHKRWSVERVFKSLKESRRLDEHCIRGLKQITLHASMSVLVYQANAIVKAQAGKWDELRWQVRKVA